MGVDGSQVELEKRRMGAVIRAAVLDKAGYDTNTGGAEEASLLLA